MLQSVDIAVAFAAALRADSGAVASGGGLETPPLSGSAWLMVMGMGATGTASQLLMTRAYALTRAARVAVFLYITPVAAYLFGAALLHEIPGPYQVVGAALVILSGKLASRESVS